MLQKLLLIVLVLLPGSFAFAQSDVLSVRVTKDFKAIILSLNDKPLIKNINNITLKGTEWNFKVQSDEPARVILATAAKEKIIDKNGTYPVKDLKFADNFQLQKSFTVRVEKMDKTSLQTFSVRLVDGGGGNGDADPDPGPEGDKIKEAKGNGRSLIYDALFLADKNTPVPLKLNILNLYAPGLDTSGKKDLKKEYKNNSFLIHFVDSVVGTGASQSTGSMSSILSAVGGLDVTSVADGMARFLVNRAKKELSIHFFEKLKDTITKTKDLKTLFPDTYALLLVFDQQIYNYEQYLQNLREAFKTDISKVHRNLSGIVDNHQKYFNDRPILRGGFLSACYIAVALDDKVHPGDVIDNYPVNYLDGIPNKNYKGTIQTIRLLSYSLRDTATGENAGYWVPVKAIRDLVNDKEALRLYFGLLAEEAKKKYDNIPFEGSLTLPDILEKVAVEYDKSYDTYLAYKNYVQSFGQKLEAVNELIRNERNDKETLTDSARVEKYIKYFRTTIDILEYSAEFCKLPVIKDLKPLGAFYTKVQPYFHVSEQCASLVTDVTRRNYSGIVNHAVQIYQSIITPTAAATPDPGDNVATSVKKQKKENKTVAAAAVAAVSPDENRSYALQALDAVETMPSLSTLQKLAKYGSFMANVATAKSSAEVQEAIESSALPVGSARIKRTTIRNIAINGYAGLFFGAEKIRGVDDKAKFNTFGVTAPIGVSISWGHRFLVFPTGNKEWSTSFFLSLVDLGAVAAFRFKDDTTAQVPTIQLKNIFSPGAFLSVGFPKSPLSLNLGWQVGPNLRKVKTDPVLENELSDKLYTRVSIGLVVDIPLWNLYTKN